MIPPTLVLLPGLDGTGDFFAPLLEALDDRIPSQIVRYPLDGASDYATCEAIARAALPADRPYVVLGESFSGPIAISIAATAPVGLVGLVLCATFVCNPRPRMSVLRPLLPVLPLYGGALSRRLSRWRVLGRWATPAICALHHDILSRLPSTTIRSRLEAVMDCDVREALQAVRVPQLCLTARHDRLIPRAATRLIQQHAAAATMVQLDAPHCLLQCAPQAAAELIQTFQLSAVGIL